MHYAVPEILYKHNLLHRFYTDMYTSDTVKQRITRLSSVVESSILKSIQGRNSKGLPNSKVNSFPFFGISYYIRRQLFAKQVHLWAGKRFNNLVIRNADDGGDAFYVFNTAGLEIIKYAQRKGKKSVLEQTIAPLEFEKKILKEESESKSEWCKEKDKYRYNQKMLERENKEWKHADVILCGSRFVKETIKKCGGPYNKCKVVPYGIDLQNVNEKVSIGKNKSKKIRVVTVGTINIRKGIQYTYEAASKLRHCADFRVVGPIGIPENALEKLRRRVEVTGPVPRSQVESHYQWADVFLLPSLCEGSATVCYEALAHGLPVITTPNAGSIVRDGREGFTIPIKSTEAIVDKIKRLSNDRRLLEQMSERAYERSKKGSIKSYESRLIKLLE